MINELGKKAKIAEREIRIATTQQKNNALNAIKEALPKNVQKILVANDIDLEKAESNGISKVMQDRLRLTEERIINIANAVGEIVALPDPVGEIDGGCVRPNGLRITKQRVPMGVIGIIFESRPNVTVDAAVLCLKSGNAVILRGGKEAVNSNIALAEVMREAIAPHINPDVIQLVTDTSREVSTQLMQAREYLDLLIPRGGAGLINTVCENAKVPVIETGVGNCHVYVDEFSHMDMALKIADNAKCQRPSVCNAIENLLVHKNIAEEFLPKLFELWNDKVEMRGCERSKAIININSATEEDYYTEYNDLIIAIKIVDTIEEAMSHIEKYGSKHSETIVTYCYSNAEKFQKQVDAAAVYVNASTRFTDGGEFGLGAEIGISTQKLHARGPMGLKELTTVKYLVNGNGQVR
ncbi:MAG: glutamate-5-semialdehyde dehydrogenase [Oscillospiraceae bacterium]|jgi:glutamate-5-semialdehyde dehydrogenase|nr:glutamate-5-semialdehyde dehydrogenase [Oscillospiraceae bacterium]